MLFLKTLRRRRGGPGRDPGRARASRRPVLEALETRTLPSILTVTKVTDSGLGSLRAALADAASGDTIDFAPSLAGQTIALTSGELVVDKGLDIEGLGAPLLTVSGSDSSRVFDMTTDEAVTVAGLTIAHGLATQGAGINHVAGTLDVVGCSLTDNEALGAVGADAPGGGLFNAAGATLQVAASTFRGNRAVGQASPAAGGLPGGLGGAVFNQGDATVAGSTFRDNLATNVGGGSLTGGRGGAVWNGTANPPVGSAATLTVTDSSFLDNQAIGGPGDPGGIGGRALGGGIFNRYATLTVHASTFTGNVAAAGPSGAGAPGNFAGGGGIANTTGGTLTLDQGALIGNEATAGDAGPGAGSGGNAEGGAVYSEAQAAVTGALVSDNHVQAGAGSPGGFGFGGGLVNFGTLTVASTRLVSNQAVGGAGRAGGAGGNASGGAIRAQGTTAVLRSLLAGNQVTGGAGDAGAPGGDALGGALRNVGAAGETDSLSLEASVLRDNQVVGGAAGAGASGGQARGGAIDTEGPSALTVSTSVLSGNQALGGTGMTGGNGLGGGLYITDGPVSLDRSLISGNQAVGGSGTTDGAGVGGGVYIASGTATRQQVRIVGNSASTSNDDVFGVFQ